MFFMQTDRMGFSKWSTGDLPFAQLLWGNPKVTKYICANGSFDDCQIRGLHVGDYILDTGTHKEADGLLVTLGKTEPEVHCSLFLGKPSVCSTLGTDDNLGSQEGGGVNYAWPL